MVIPNTVMIVNYFDIFGNFMNFKTYRVEIIITEWGEEIFFA